MMKAIKQFIIALVTLLIFISTGEATNVNILNYYPSTNGVYDKFLLIPRSSALTDPCVVGTIYINSSGVLQFCRDNAGTGQWGAMTDTWAQNSDLIYLSDTVNAPVINVGIGTTTPQFKLTISEGGILAKGTLASGTLLPSLGAGSRMIWYPRKSALRAGYVSGTQWDDANIGNYSIAFGKDTTASGLASLVVGGDTNMASGDYSLVAGGKQNTASARASTVLGGFTNTASGQWSTVNGGRSNTASGDYSAIGGGNSNTASASNTSIGGGASNGVSSPYSTIIGGFRNIINTLYSNIGYSTIAGGRDNTSQDQYQMIGGGYSNSGRGAYLTILGGNDNSSTARNTNYNDYATILGGSLNDSSGGNYSVSGGTQNFAVSTYGVALGGQNNNNTYEGAIALLDLTSNVVGGGSTNAVGQNYSTIIAGSNNYLWGDYSFASGRGMKLGNFATPANRSFLWGYDASASPPTITTSDAFMIATGRVGFRDYIPAALLEINANGTTDNYLRIGKASKGNIFVINKDANAAIKVKLGSGNASPTNAWDVATANNAYLTTGGVWTNASSRIFKQNIHALTSQESLYAFRSLRPVTFRYQKDHSASVGFIAEDVPEIVAMNDHQTISAMDMTALLTDVAKQQDEQIRQQADELNELGQRIINLKNKIALRIKSRDQHEK